MVVDEFFIFFFNCFSIKDKLQCSTMSQVEVAHDMSSPEIHTSRSQLQHKHQKAIPCCVPCKLYRGSNLSSRTHSWFWNCTLGARLFVFYLRRRNQLSPRKQVFYTTHLCALKPPITSETRNLLKPCSLSRLGFQTHHYICTQATRKVEKSHQVTCTRNSFAN